MHLTGVLMVILSLGGITMHIINGGDKNHSWKKSAAITHGVGLLLSLVGGFGLLARLGIVQGGLPGWVYAKLAIWLVFGGLTAVLYKKKVWAKKIWHFIFILAGFAAYLAGYKPF